jgi:hypothetical protein
MMLLVVGVEQVIWDIKLEDKQHKYMIHITHLKSTLSTLLLVSFMQAGAQSYVTYNHDAAKQNQITVQELGAGSLTPTFYYWVFHNSYRKTAAQKNKMTYRSLTGVSAYPQVEDADSIESALKKRAEIEALNVADRQIDIAWLAEGSKINSKLSDFQGNINRIISVGGTVQDKERWNDYYHIFECAIKATKEAYMPNAQRKREYLAIYADISKQNNTLIGFLVQLNRKSKTSELLSATYDKSDHKANIALAAKNRWKNASRNTASSSGGTNNGNDSDNETITQE